MLIKRLILIAYLSPLLLTFVLAQFTTTNGKIYYAVDPQYILVECDVNEKFSLLNDSIPEPYINDKSNDFFRIINIKAICKIYKDEVFEKSKFCLILCHLDQVLTSYHFHYLCYNQDITELDFLIIKMIQRLKNGSTQTFEEISTPVSNSKELKTNKFKGVSKNYFLCKSLSDYVQPVTTYQATINNQISGFIFC